MSTINTLSTLQMSLHSRRLVADLNGKVADATQELSTGYRKDVYRDLGARSAQALDFRNRMSRTEEFVLNNEVLAGKLEMMEDALGGVRDALQEFMNIAVGSATSPNQLATTLQDQAQATLNFVITGLNAAYGGEYLFSGVDTDRKPMQDLWTANPGSGQSPAQVINGIVGPGPVNAADAALKIGQLDAVFGDTAANPADNYEATFYNGTALMNGAVPNPRATGQIDDETRMTYGVQANDPAMRAAMKGLLMFASVDVSTIGDPAAYAAWAAEAVDAIASGLSGLDDARVQVGSQRGLLEDMVARQHARQDIYSARIVALETVDPYQTAARLQAFQVQLEATYSATARIAQLSFLNFM